MKLYLLIQDSRRIFVQPTAMKRLGKKKSHMQADNLMAKLICDITKRGAGYRLTFTALGGDMKGNIKIDALPTCTGLGASITINENANFYDALKAIELRIY